MYRSDGGEEEGELGMAILSLRILNVSGFFLFYLMLESLYLPHKPSSSNQKCERSIFTL